MTQLAAMLADMAPPAEQRVRPFVRETPVEYSPVLSEATGAQVFLKLENLQVTGSFKVRGAFNKLLGTPRDGYGKGVATASTGNHGLAVALVADQLQLEGTIFLSSTISQAKLVRIRRSGVTVRLRDGDCADVEAAARSFATRGGLMYVPPYNDIEVIAGQGTLGVEIGRQVEAIDDLFIAVGGGGLISGVAAYLKRMHPKLRVFGCQPFNSRVMMESVAAGRILNMDCAPTLSDATAGGIEPESITFPLCQVLVDDFVAVSEDQIRQGLRLVLDAHHTLIEGAAAVAVAGLLKSAGALRGRRAVVVLCGSNISCERLNCLGS